MDYKLIKATNNDKDIIKKYVFDIISKDASENKLDDVKDYINKKVDDYINEYQLIVVNNKIIGCVLLKNISDGLLVDEIYIEESFRSQGIGSNIIYNILRENKNVYLWVYKSNIKSMKLYKKLGFNIIDETETRLYMKNEN